MNYILIILFIVISLLEFKIYNQKNMYDQICKFTYFFKKHPILFLLSQLHLWLVGFCLFFLKINNLCMYILLICLFADTFIKCYFIGLNLKNKITNSYKLLMKEREITPKLLFFTNFATLLTFTIALFY